jgi:hypothetical protein
MQILLIEWAKTNFSVIPSPTTLSNYAKTKQIRPHPVKFGGKWMCEPDAKFVGIQSNYKSDIDNPIALEFLDGC